ncbi:MAG: bifunctional sugar-1-phosphate nucleotidylyltransferase/acetyltransferase [Candidatus Hodarchaeota archaeon]
MKAIILAAGEGKRLRPITSTIPKPMIPLAGKPLLEHLILGLKKAGIDHVILVVGYKKEIIKNYFRDGSERFNIKIDYITQNEYLGTAHAFGFAKKFVKNESLLMMYGDIFVESTIFSKIINKYNESKCEGIISLFEVENPQEYGVITLDRNGFITKITEKPSPDLNFGNLINAGIFIFDSLIFKAIEMTQKSKRDEFEFTDSMEILIEQLNGKIASFIIKDSFWSDIGLPWQLFDANQILLNNLEKKVNGIIEDGVNITGNVYIGNNTKIRTGSYIQGPCYIGENSIIGPNAFIRPYTSIGNNCHIGMSETKNSLIFTGTKIPHFNYIGDSIICENVNLGAGTKISNLRFDNKNVIMTINNKLVNSGRRKLGAIIGPNSQTGINASIMCGKKIGENSIIGAHTLVNEDIPPNTLFYQDSNGKLLKKKNPF